MLNLYNVHVLLNYELAAVTSSIYTQYLIFVFARSQLTFPALPFKTQRRLQSCKKFGKYYILKIVHRDNIIRNKLQRNLIFE